MPQCINLQEKKKKNSKLWDKRWPVKLINNKLSKRHHKPFNKTLTLSNWNVKKSKNLKIQSTWAWCNSKPKSMTKRKTLPRTKASSKNSKETEICTKRSSKDRKPTTKKFTKKLLTRKRYSRKKKTNCSDRKSKFKNSTSKSQTWKRKGTLILSKPHLLKLSTFMLEIKWSWETTLSPSSKNKTWKPSPNLKNNNLCMKQSGLTEI